MKSKIKKMKFNIKRFRIRKKHVISLIIIIALVLLATFGYTYYIVDNADYFLRITQKDMVNETYLDESSNAMGNGSRRDCTYYAISGRFNAKISETLAVENSSEDVRDGTRFYDGQGKDYFYAALRFRFKQDPDKVFQRYKTIDSSFGSGYKIEYKTYTSNGARLSDIEETILDKIFTQLHSGYVSDSKNSVPENILLEDLILIRDHSRYIVIADNTIYKTDYQHNLIKLMQIPDGYQLDYVWFTKNVYMV